MPAGDVENDHAREGAGSLGPIVFREDRVVLGAIGRDRRREAEVIDLYFAQGQVAFLLERKVELVLRQAIAFWNVLLIADRLEVNGPLLDFRGRVRIRQMVISRPTMMKWHISILHADRARAAA